MEKSKLIKVSTYARQEGISVPAVYTGTAVSVGNFVEKLCIKYGVNGKNVRKRSNFKTFWIFLNFVLTKGEWRGILIRHSTRATRKTKTFGKITGREAKKCLTNRIEHVKLIELPLRDQRP